jgi:hypothetical protein
MFLKLGFIPAKESPDLHLVLDRRAYLKKQLENRNWRADVAGFLGFFSSKNGQTGTRYKSAGDFEIVEGFKDDAGEVWDSIRAHFDLGIERTKQYLEWRYDPNWDDYKILSAIHGGETAGYAVYRTLHNHGPNSINLCEFLSRGDEETVYEELGKVLVRKAREEQAAFISAFGSCSIGCRSVLSKMGFAAPDLAFWKNKLRPTLYPFVNEERDRLKEAKRYYSLGDTDSA